MTRRRAIPGLVVPGLGHLLTGELIIGLALLSMDFVLIWALTAAPRLPTVLAPAFGGLSIHAVVATLSWPVVALAVWYIAYRLAFPRDEAAASTYGAVIWRQFKRNRAGITGLCGVALIVALALFAPLLAPYDPDAPNLGPYCAGPSAAFWLGTDYVGRDVLSRLLFGARISLAVGFFGVGIASTIGVIIGATAGYAGGRVDRALMWFVDLMLSLPTLVLIMALIAVLRTKGNQGVVLIVLILGFTGWMGVSRVVRSQILSLKAQEFVQAARALGFSTPRIVFGHLIPNALAPVIVHCSLAIGSLILVEAGLSYLGLGVSMPTATWGNMVVDGRGYLNDSPGLVVLPGLAIVAAVMSFNLLGDGLRDALDPKLRGR